MKRQTSQPADARWDAGDAGCSRLIVGVRREIERLAPGQTLKVLARNAGAKLDLWVWCRMTGHCLVAEAHPVYVIRRKPLADDRNSN